MFVETSAIVEFLTGQPEAGQVLEALETAPTRFSTSPVVEFEATVVIATRLGCPVADARRQVTDFLDAVAAERMAITAEVGALALAAFERYGKGRGHPARLNLGDCFSYACARAAGVPLLHVGEDFARTDLA